MELVAAVEALRPLPDHAQIELHSDSEYLIYGMRAFVFRWQRQGWRNRRGVRLQHRELWVELLALGARLRDRWLWLRGHNGHRYRLGPMRWRIRLRAVCGFGRKPRLSH